MYNYFNFFVPFVNICFVTYLKLFIFLQILFQVVIFAVLKKPEWAKRPCIKRQTRKVRIFFCLFNLYIYIYIYMQNGLQSFGAIWVLGTDVLCTTVRIIRELYRCKGKKARNVTAVDAGNIRVSCRVTVTKDQMR